MQFNKKSTLVGAAVTVAVVAISIGIYFVKNAGHSPMPWLTFGHAYVAQDQMSSAHAPAVKTITLEDAQLKSIKIEPAGEHLFANEREAIGSIDFNEDRSVQVYPTNQGKIVGLFANLGDEVVKGKKLYTIESPDLIQAESTLIATAGVLDLTTKVLERARKLYEAQGGVSQRELEQAISDQQTAEGALKAARPAVSIFGKTDAEIDQIIAKRRIDPVMVVPSPITGRITARNAAARTPGATRHPACPILGHRPLDHVDAGICCRKR